MNKPQNPPPQNPPSQAVHRSPQLVHPQSQAVRPPPQAVHPQSQAVHPPPQAVHPQSQAVHPPRQAVHPPAQPIHPPPQPFRPPKKGGRTNLASCVVATIFLIFVAIVILIVFFSVFKPKNPKISVNAVQLPSFAVTNGTVSFTFSQYVSVRNPNRAVFNHYDSTLQLIYAGNQVGFMFIPAGKINGGRTQYMSATFAVQSFPVAGPPATNLQGPSYGVDGFHPVPSLEVESRLNMEGRVRILHFFTHHVDAQAGCRVAISLNDGSVLGFRC